MLITAEDIRTYIAYGIALGGIPAFTCMMFGIFWRVIRIIN